MYVAARSTGRRQNDFVVCAAVIAIREKTEKLVERLKSKTARSRAHHATRAFFRRPKRRGKLVSRRTRFTPEDVYDRSFRPSLATVTGRRDEMRSARRLI